MKKTKHRKKNARQIARELQQINKEVAKKVSSSEEEINRKPSPMEDDFTKKLVEQERAFLNPEEWGIHLRPIIDEVLSPPSPDEIDDHRVTGYLRCLVDILAQHHFCLTNTNHLSDRELYRVIMTDILEKPIGVSPNASGMLLHHECCPCDTEEYFIYYEDELGRSEYQSLFGGDLPEKRPLVSDRDTWIELLAEAYRDQPVPTFE